MKELLLSKGKLPKLKFVDLDMCVICILEKQKNVSLLKGSRASKSRDLELVHTSF